MEKHARTPGLLLGRCYISCLTETVIGNDVLKANALGCESGKNKTDVPMVKTCRND